MVLPPIPASPLISLLHKVRAQVISNISNWSCQVKMGKEDQLGTEAAASIMEHQHRG